MNDFVSLSFDNNMFIYTLVNYDNGGILINIYKSQGLQGLDHLFKSNEFRDYMYQKGNGKQHTEESKISSVIHYHNVSDANNSKQIRLATKHICWKLQLRGIYGESLLHILIICNTNVHTMIAKQLLQIYPNLVHDIFEDSTYYGVSALHLAIIYKNNIISELLLECNANVHQRASGQFFIPQQSIKVKIPNFSDSRYFGEYPLAWAASIDDKRIYNSLINYGADPNLVDNFGNMVLHVIVAREKLMIFDFALRHPIRPAINDMANNYGLTPLALACVLGKAIIFREIIELSCQEFWTYNIVTCCVYPLNVVDSMQMNSADTEGRSALSIILEGNKSEHLNMLKGGVIQKLLEEKWKTFGHFLNDCFANERSLTIVSKLFLRRIFLTLLHLLILSLAIFLRPPKNVLLICESKFKKVLRIIAEVLTCISCARHIFGQFMEFFNKRKCNILSNLRKNFPRSIFLLSNILIITCFITRMVGYEFLEEIFLIVALPCSWFFLMFFAAAVRLTGPFVSMVRYMLVEDMRQFSIIYLVFLYGFSQVFYFLLKHSPSHTKSSNHSSYYQTWMELFRMTLGAHEYEELRNSYYNWLTQFFFVLFMIIMPILLLNMLIAMMGNTYALVISQSEREWTMQWAKILLELEKSLSPKESKLFLSQYTISIAQENSPEKQLASLMVIKKMNISKAKQRKQAIANWRKLKWRVKLLISNRDNSQ